MSTSPLQSALNKSWRLGISPSEDAVSLFGAVVFLLLGVLLLFSRCCYCCSSGGGGGFAAEKMENGGGYAADLKEPCDELYMVREGETLPSIMEKCGDPYVVERNPHLDDPDEIYPGLVIKISPSR